MHFLNSAAMFRLVDVDSPALWTPGTPPQEVTGSGRSSPHDPAESALCRVATSGNPLPPNFVGSGIPGPSGRASSLSLQPVEPRGPQYRRPLLGGDLFLSHAPGCMVAVPLLSRAILRKQALLSGQSTQESLWWLQLFTLKPRVTPPDHSPRFPSGQ